MTFTLRDHRRQLNPSVQTAGPGPLSRTDARSVLGKTKRHHPILPIPLERGHVGGSKDRLQRFVSRWIRLLIGDKGAIVGSQKTLFLQVIQQVARLGIIRAWILVVELTRRGRCQGLEGGQAPPFNGILQPL